MKNWISQQQKPIADNTLNSITISFLNFYNRGGVQKAVKKMGWVRFREIAKRRKVSEKILKLFDVFFEKERRRKCAQKLSGY